MSTKNHEYVKLAKSLHMRKFREKHGLFMLEGIRLVEEAIQAGIRISFALYSDKLQSSERGTRLLEKLRNRGIFLGQVEENILKGAADTENPQGILAVALMDRKQPGELNRDAESLLLFVDGVQDPGNLGTMIRTACAAGASGVILPKGTVDVYHPKVVRASMGSIFNIPVISAGDDREVLISLKDKGYRVMVADLSGEKWYYQVDAGGPLVWVLGNEAHGPRPLFLHHADEVVKIPLIGKAESLNVAVAAGVLLYETVRQRGGERR